MIHEIIFNDYIRKVKLSSARRIKYYEKGKALPKAKKYNDATNFSYKPYKNKIVLFDLAENVPVIANPKANGTPLYEVINAQKIYNGHIREHTRSKMVSAIKSFYKEEVEKLPFIDYPIRIEMEIYDTILEHHETWDVGNRAWLYAKCFEDTLTGNKDKNGVPRNKIILNDDSNVFVTQAPVARFIPIDEGEIRKLVFRLIPETDESVVNRDDFKKEREKVNSKNGKRYF